MQKTFSPKAKEITREWHVIDASGVPLGRLASQVAQLLRGKHKPTFAPHLDSGDHVIVLNAANIALTGAKLDQKKYYRHSGYPGGFKETPVRVVLDKYPERVIERAVRGMVPHTSLGKAQLRHLHVYAGSTHPHTGQVAQSRAATEDASEEEATS
jgi:large subunit ribosomal protein L13